MDATNTALLDVNTAGQSELETIPGVGPAMARKIVAARPYSCLDDLLKVKGINRDFLQRISPHFQFINAAPEPALETEELPIPIVNETGHADGMGAAGSPVAPEGEEADSIQEKIQDFLEDQPEKIQSFFAEQPKKAQEFLADQPEKVKEFISESPKKVQDFINDQPEKIEKIKASTGMSNANLWTLLAACAATMLLTILLMLGLLGMINGGLRYASAGEFTALSRQVESSSSKLEMLEKDTDSIRSRLDALESMSGRMTLIEEENASLRTQLEENSRQVSEVRAQIEQAQARMDELQKSTDTFDRIINGLRSLLNETALP